MYELVDRPVTVLGAQEQAVLKAMRLWVWASRRGDGAFEAVAPLFAMQAMTAAILPFSRLMALLDGKARLPLYFCHPDCPAITPDEAILLTLLRDARAARLEKARVSMNLLVGSAQADQALLAALEWVDRSRVTAKASTPRSGRS